MAEYIAPKPSAGYSGGLRANAGVVFIGTAGHSGSTLLGLALGAHPSIFYAGEADTTQYFGDQSVPLKKRVCRVCGPECVVWGDLRVEPGQDLYEVLSRRTGRPIVFDSAKGTEWIKHQVAALHRVVPLHLIAFSRDGRAVVNSNLRKYPGTSAQDHATRWVEQMRDVEELASNWPASVHRLRYEEFASRPIPTLRTLANFLGIAFDPAMPDPWYSEQHPLGGNNGPLHLLRRRSRVRPTARTRGRNPVRLASPSAGQSARTAPPWPFTPPAVVVHLGSSTSGGVPMTREQTFCGRFLAWVTG